MIRLLFVFLKALVRLVEMLGGEGAISNDTCG